MPNRVRLGADLTQSLATRERSGRPAEGAVPGAFRNEFNQARVGRLSERIDQSLAEVDDLAQRLGRSFSMADLRRYRQAIKELFQDLTSGMHQVRAELEWDSQAWEHRTLVTIRTVDKELEKLAEMVLAQEQDRMSILAKLDEIKGMLLDIRI